MEENIKSGVNLQYVTYGQETDESIDIRSLFEKFQKNWWYFIVSVLFALTVAYLVNKFTHPKYEVRTSLVIDEKSNSPADATAKLMKEIGFLGGDKNFENEVFLLKTNPLIQSALEKLDFQISYFKKTTFGKIEIYKSSPFVVLLNKEHPQPVGCKISIKILNDKTYQLTIDQKEMKVYSFVSNQTTQIVPKYKTEINLPFGEYKSTNYYDLKIMLNDVEDIEELINKEYFFVINTDKNLTRYYKKEMVIAPPNKKSTVAEIIMKSTVPIKTIDFLNSLTEAYLNKEFQQKQSISEKTIEYINSQLEKVSESLNIAEDSLQRFRSQEKVLDVTMQSTQIIQELKDLKKEKAILDVNLQYVDYIQNYFKNNTVYTDIISPASMGITDPTLNSLIDELINLNIEKVSLVDNNQEKNPYLQKINIRIENLRNMIAENIEYIRRTTSIAINDADSRIRQLNNEIQKMPETERELLGFERVFNINNNIYTYLLEKRSEAEITKASYQPNIEIAEPANIVGKKPISPNKPMNYMIALIFGLVFPFGTIYLKDLLNTKFVTTEEIKEASPVPVIGEIYHNSKKIEDVVLNFPDSHISESFRKLNINLKYFLNNSTGKAIALSSTISGEGKSFLALNLAHIIANNNYKTILVGFDIRRPKIYSSLRDHNAPGISDLLSNQANLEDIVQKTQNDFLDIIPAGGIPPNPAELLASDRTSELINELKELYDFVIIDTPPVGIVIDGFNLMNKTDMNIFVSRLKYTPKKEFEKIMAELKEKKLINGLIVNDIVADRKTKYGYNYYTA